MSARAKNWPGLGLAFFMAAQTAGTALPFGNEAQASGAPDFPQWLDACAAFTFVNGETGETLSKNADVKRSPASITKVMTAMLLFDALEAGEISLETEMKISPRAKHTVSSGLGGYGSKITVEKAIPLLLHRSSNGAAKVIAAALVSGEPENYDVSRAEEFESMFTDKMDKRAREIGMTDTDYGSVEGFDHIRIVGKREQLTTSSDQILLLEYLSENYADYLKYFRDDYGVGSTIPDEVRNKGFHGKTGTSNKAGSNLAMTHHNGNRGVVKGCSSSEQARSVFMAGIERIMQGLNEPKRRPEEPELLQN